MGSFWRRGSGKPVWKHAAAALAGAMLLVATPALAQFSAGYKFLEAVKKKDGVAVEEAVSEPGSTIINTRDVTSGETALHIVTSRRDATWLSYLVAKGANVNARDSRGVTPLQIATNFGWIEGVQVLVDAKARLDDSNDAGETPLIAAVHRGDVGIVRLLLRSGADPDRKDNSGRSARDYALLEGPGSVLVSVIVSEARKKGAGQAGSATYGPTF